MSRDPLEGIRPSDTATPSFALAPPVSFGQPVSSGPALAPPPVRGSSTKIVLVVIGVLVAMSAGIAAYFLTLPHGALAPKAKPSATPTAEVVKQGAAPTDTPPPAPAK